MALNFSLGSWGSIRLDKRQGNDLYRPRLSRRWQGQLGADFIAFLANIGERDVLPKTRRVNRTCDVPSLLSPVRQAIPLCGQCRQVVGQFQTAQRLGDLAIRANSGDDLLADVTAFVVADG